ncbi:PilZ domain-containing protein [Thalassobaculum salexigens]|uniref:PilZ domain-containing protein n=1 Tax=Thalassobaculum salexigens TaxID=455360 RepID=UPI0004054981|nr:PilZ domain-containing protein [Thalassobaculum salexigens]
MWSAIKSVFSGDSDRRVAPRVAAIGTVTIDSSKFALENWSQSGILISGHDGRLIKGQKFKMTVEVRDDSRVIVFNAEAVVVRAAGDKLAAQFHRIDKHKKQAIVEYFAHKTGSR